MARGIDRTELLELLAETVNNENPMLHLMSGNVCWSWISSFCELFWTLPTKSPSQKTQKGSTHTTHSSLTTS